jgi:hypothetical protein
MAAETRTKLNYDQAACFIISGAKACKEKVPKSISMLSESPR